MLKPTVGRIVHYYHQQGDTMRGPLAAIVTSADGDVVGLRVFDSPAFRRMSLEVRHAEAVPFSPTPKAGCWTWPPREG